jgi:hypothetical protein
MLDTINNDADANVTLQYSRLKDKFIMTADSGGEDSKITIINNSGNAFGDNSAFRSAPALCKTAVIHLPSLTALLWSETATATQLTEKV